MAMTEINCTTLAFLFNLNSTRKTYGVGVKGINLPSSLIVAILSPVAGSGNALVLAEIMTSGM